MIDLPFLTNLLLTVNDILASAVLIVSFSLLVYLVLQNRYTPIARALAVLLGSIVVVFGGDVLTQQVQREETLHFLLRAQWLGIVGVPAGYIHLADALLDFSGQHNLRRRWSVPMAYVISAVFWRWHGGQTWCYATASRFNLLHNSTPVRSSGSSRSTSPSRVSPGWQPRSTCATQRSHQPCAGGSHT